jgi:two-component system sensor histidine kinase/response regulator
VTPRAGEHDLQARVAALEAALVDARQQADRLRSLLDAAPLPIYAKDRAQRFTFSNRMHTSLVGLPRDEILGRTDAELFGGDASPIDETTTTVLDSGAAHVTEFDLPIDGARRTYLETVYALGAGAWALGGIAYDISDRKEAERSVRRLAKALEQSREAVEITDTDGRIIFVNAAFVERSGYSRQELLGQHNRILSSGRTPRATYDELWAALREGRSWEGEFVNRRKDGGEYTEHGTISPVRDDDGQVTSYVAIKQDVTELRRLEAELARHQRHLEDLVTLRTSELAAVFRALPDRYFRLDATGRVLEALGVDASASRTLVWHRLADLLFPEAPARFDRAVEDARARRSMVVVEHETADGRVWEARVIPLSPNITLAVVREITDWREAQREIALARDEAVRASEVKSDFLARMSHEMRTPLAAVSGFSKLLLDTDLTADQQSIAKHLDRNANHLLVLVDDLLDIAAIEAGRLEVTSESLFMGRLVEDAVAPFRRIADRRSVTLDIDTTAAPGAIGDPTRMRQVITNLVSNAVKYTDTGRVEVRVTEDATPSGRWCRLDVTDTGVGISEDDLKVLFAPFTQLHGRRAARGRGVGLGLAICARLVDAMGGHIEVASTLGVGSRFTVRLPLAADVPLRDPTQPPVPPRDPSPTLVPGLHVLVVDDDYDMQLLLQRMLAALGATATLAENGETAIGAIRTEEARGARFDAVMLDMQMPVLDGYETAARLRAEGCALPIVALTAFAMEGDRQRCLAAGCDAYLSKPVDLRALRNALHAVLPRPAGT